MDIVITDVEVRVNARTILNALDNKAVSLSQIEKVVQQYIGNRYPVQAREKILRTGEGKAALDAYLDAVGTFKDQALALLTRKRAAMAYEQARRDVAKAARLIDGVPEVPAVERVLAEYDSDTGEELVAYVAAVEAIPPVQAIPAIPAIEPLAQTVDIIDDEGQPGTVDNPAYVEALTLRDNAQALIDAASQDVLDLVEVRDA